MRKKDTTLTATALNARLCQLIDLLNHYQEYHWAAHFQKVSDYLAEDELANGLEMLAGSYGGMGSFQDLVLHSNNGHALLKEELGTANEELNRLRMELYKLGHSWKHQ